MGWSMGGHAALRLGGLLGPDRVAAVVAASLAIWIVPDDASDFGFTDAAEYERFAVVGRQRDSGRSRVRVDCGTGTCSTAPSRTTSTGSPRAPT